MNKQTADKAHVAAGATLMVYLLALFGVGDAPVPETVADAATVVGGALVLSGLSWLATWLRPNHDKEPR